MNKKIFSGLFALSFAGISLSAQETVVRSYDLKEVVVTATRMQLPLAAVPQKIEIIDKQKILSVPNENVADLLKRTTNLDIIQYPGASASVGMRGFPPSAHNRNYTLVLVDGKPAGTTNLSSIPSDFVQRIEVVKGPYSVLYGSDAMGGVINIVTRKPDHHQTGSASINAGNFGQTNINGYASGSISDKSCLLLGFSRKVQEKDYRIGSKNLLSINETGKKILDEQSYGSMMTNTGYSINQFTGGLNYRWDKVWSADAAVDFVASNDIETPGNYWHSYGLSKKDFNRHNASLDIKREVDHDALLCSLYSSKYDENNYNNSTDEAFIDSKEKIGQYGIKINDLHSWNNISLISGMDVDVFDVSSQRFSDKITPINPYRPDHSNLATSVFVQGSYQGDDFFVNAGLRYNYTRFTLEADKFLGNDKKSTGYSNLNPSVGIKYSIFPMLNIHASAGNAFYVPDAYKTAGMYQVGKKQYRGNENLKAETSTSFDIGLNIFRNDILDLDVTCFHAFYNNKIIYDYSHNDYITYKNADDARMNGLEIVFSSNIARMFHAGYNLKLYASVTHLFNDNFDEVAVDAENNKSILTKDMLYVRKTTGNFSITYDNRKGFITCLNARYIGNRLENDWLTGGEIRPDITSDDYYAKGGYRASDKILQHPAHLIFDYSAFCNLGTHARMGISVANLFDENYTEKDGYNMPGRSIMGHVSYLF